MPPNRFTPDKNVLKELGVEEGEKYVIIRFVAWNASHDLGHKGISYENKLRAVSEMSKYAKVFISAEGELPKELEQYRFKITPDRMHDALAFATLVFGESSTMAEEAAMLGVPNILLTSIDILYIKHLCEKHDICYSYTDSSEDQEKAINRAVELIQMDYATIKQEWSDKSQRLLNDKIDVTAFLVWFLENYPESKKIMKENPEYQYNFK